ncbi:hypothetical protein K504DRAFT_507071 [Pleomassaria siparia CBS 279.74]|uniref:Rhodopsin domain-containing protein n=1 Tax=Pleomassaria siparia CBS 279.74 TaxID=1314801 RepID=A0A6G1JVM7_9PLEO|nr:hypothetical protein K504DRAFT_507071 [Pleomassaria siparia CBS 279.74]
MGSDNLSEVEWEDLPVTMSRSSLERVNTAMLVLTSLFFVARVLVRVTKRKPFELHDILCYSSYICYVAMWVMYWKEIDPLYKLQAVQRGEAPPYGLEEMLHDAGMLFRWLTAGQLLFYISLALVKLSLMSLYRRLLDQTPPKFTIMWWVILTFCILSFIGSTMTTIFVCDDQKAKYNQGICVKPNEQKRAQFSLWFAYALDVTTDLAVMFLLFRMTWKLQMPQNTEAWCVCTLRQWLDMHCMFLAGPMSLFKKYTDIASSRSLPYVSSKSESKMEYQRLQMRTVIIGCAPAFAGIIRNHFGTKNAVSYDSRGYVKHSADEIKMQSVGRSSTRIPDQYAIH